MTAPQFPDFPPSFSTAQQELISLPAKGATFLSGLACTGKTTASAARIANLAQNGVPGGTFLILVPQRSLAELYQKLIHSPQFPSGALPTILTFGGLAQRMVDLFWPLAAAQAGFTPEIPPKFLTLETAQYFMAKIVKPMIQNGEFMHLKLDPNRLVSQVLDNLNKSAFVGFSYDSIADRLSEAWIGEPAQIQIYRQVQEAASEFRALCYQNNLLDYSLQVEVFLNHLWPSPLVKKYLSSQYHHLVYDNMEEDVPVAHDLVREWLPDFDSALLICNLGGGFRTYLGADPSSAQGLAEGCARQVSFSRLVTRSEPLSSVGSTLSNIIMNVPSDSSDSTGNAYYEIKQARFISDMVDDVCNEADRLISQEGVSPGKIAIVSPFLSDSLRFILQRRMDALKIPNQTNRPSRSLVTEPAARCLLVLSKIAHPSWKLPVSLFDVRTVFMEILTDGDLNRADLLARIVTQPHKQPGVLSGFSKINPEMQNRITYTVGEKYEILRTWISNYQAGESSPLDVFMSRLFGEVLSRKGLGYFGDFEASRIVSQLIQSIQKFRVLLASGAAPDADSLGKEYIAMVESGVLSAQYLVEPDEQTVDAVSISPAYSFLMSDRTVQFQFWLDVGSLGWGERLYQPLTQPYVLSRSWPAGKKWTDADELATNQRTMATLVFGMLIHCEKKVYFYSVGIDENGQERKGMLLRALQNMLKRSGSLRHSNV